MSLVPLQVARDHLRVDDSILDAQLQPYLNAAEFVAKKFINRAIFPDQTSKGEALSTVPDALIDAGVAYKAAVDDANAIADEVARCAASDYAWELYRSAQINAREIRFGVVLDDLITSAILLTLGHLFENREDVQTAASSVELPMGSRWLLQPYRVGLGV